MLEQFLSPQIVLIAVIALAVVIVFFLTLVANKVSAIDNRMAEITDGVDGRIKQSISALSNQIHADVLTRSHSTEEQLAKMGDSWRDSLNKTVTDVRGEVGRLQGEMSTGHEKLENALLENFTDHATEVNENLAQVRDNHHSEMQSYHEQLTNQVREHASSERDKLNATLNDISSSVKGNMESLAKHHASQLLDVTDKFRTGYSDMHDRVDTTIKNVSTKVTEDFSTITAKVDTTISKFDSMVKDDLQSLGTEVSDNLSNITSKLDTSVNNISSSMQSSISTLNADVNSKVSGTIEKLDQEMADTSSRLGIKLSDSIEKLDREMADTSSRLDIKLSDSIGKLDREMADTSSRLDTQMGGSIEKLDQGMTDAASKLDSGLGELHESMREGIDKLGNTMTVNFDTVGVNINQHIHKELQGLLNVFRDFSDRIQIIESTQESINELAQNVNVLSQVMDDRRARGNMGTVLIESIITDNLSPKDYQFDTELANGVKVACLLRLPKPSGNIAINTEFDISDLEIVNSPASSDAERKQARGLFAQKLEKAIAYTAANCIIDGDTAEGAVLLLPSEAAFSEAHINHRQLVDQSYKKRVWLASPSTLLAMTTVARSVIKDASARSEINVLRGDIKKISRDYARIDTELLGINRDVENLHDNMHAARKSMRRVGEHLDEVNERLANSRELSHHEEQLPS